MEKADFNTDRFVLEVRRAMLNREVPAV